MTRFVDWLLPRARILRWIAAGYTTFFVAFAGGWIAMPRPLPIALPIDRLLFALQLTAGTGFVTMAILQGLWRVADTVEAEDPSKQKESERFKVNQRVMTNTIEQTAIFVPLYLALAIRMPPEQAFLLPLFMTIWCTGRLLFWLGYQLDPAWRAIGMDWTSGIAFSTALALGATFFG